MTAAAVRQQALARAQAGDDEGAAALFAEGLRAYSSDAAFANSAGSFHAGRGRAAEALALFERALQLAPQLHEAAINRAIVLQRLDRSEEAAAYLHAREAALAGVPRYWTTRANAERAAGNLTAAVASYDAAVSREPANAKALAGRAELALDRGEDAAVAHYQRALTNTPGDPHLLLGFAHALQAAGAIEDALYVSGMLASQHPGWPAGLELHAELRWAAGERDSFVDHYAGAASPAIHHSWAAMLSGVDRHAEAADILAAARRRWPEERSLALGEAIAAGEVGDNARAAAIFREQAEPTLDWQVAEGRHLLRTGDPVRAEALLGAALAQVPGDVTAWSLRDLAWRLTDDPRHRWLHGQPGLVRVLPLDLSPADLARARSTLDRVHDRSAMPIGQSVRHGSQTRGALFNRAEPEVTLIADAIRAALERYRAGLPPIDPSHPLLRHREDAWGIAGSWSIRLDGTGHHAAHIHPRGTLSSAAYLSVPTQVHGPDQPGWLELGRPPVNLGIDLAPIATVEPKEGQLALFPSTLFHGTRPISAGRRMTVAFDVAPR